MQQNNLLKPILTIIFVFIAVGAFIYFAKSKSNVVQEQNTPVLSQTQAESLVLSTWGGCTQDTCGSVVVTVEKNIVTAVYGQLRDDSVGSQKMQATATYDGGVWVLGKPNTTISCQLDRGHQDFSTIPCN